MTSIADLYLQILVPDNKVVEEATKLILEKYQDTNSIFEIIEILKTNENPSIRKQAAIGLKTILHNFWYRYSSDESAESILNEIIFSLKNESELLVRHLIIYALEPICKYRNVVWAHMVDDLALECIQSEEPEVIDVGLSLYEVIIPFLEYEINEILEPLSEKIGIVLQNQNELIPTSSNLISALISNFDPPIPGCLEELSAMLFSGFKELLVNQYPMIHKIANNLSKIVLKEPVSSSVEHLKYLLEIANDESISPLFIYHVFTPIYTIIRKKYMEPKIYQLIPDLLAAIFRCTSISFQDDCITEQSDSLYIFNSISSIPDYDEEDGSNLFSCFSQFISDSSVEHSFTSLLIFQFFIDNYPHIIADNLKQTVSFLIQQSNTSNHHCLVEQSMICLYHLITVINGGLTQYTNEILETIMNSISFDHEQIVIEALNAIAELFKRVDFNHTLIPTIIETIVNIIRKSPDVMNGCFSALNALLFDVGTDIAPYASQIAPIFLEMVHTNENLYPISKLNASESIAQLLKNVPNEMVQYSEESMQLLIEQGTNCDDLSDLCTVFSAFLILARSNVPHLDEMLQIGTEKSVAILQMDLPQIRNQNGDDNQDEDDDNDDNFEESLPIEYEAKKTVMNFINELIPVHPDSFSNNVGDFLDILIRHIVDCYEPETREMAVKTLATFAAVNLIESETVIKELLDLDLLKDDDPEMVEKCFSSIRKILNPEITQDIVSKCVKMAELGMRNRLYCQDSEDADNYNIENAILKFLSKVAQTHTAIYPINLILETYGRRSKRDDSAHFMSLAVNSLANYLIAIKKQGLPAPPNSDMIFHIIFESLSICNGKVKPLPLLAVKELFKEEVFELAINFLEPTFQAINEICQLPNEGQPTYDETNAATASLLFVLFMLMGENFDAETYLKFMISVLPATFKNYSQDIYTSLIELFQKYTQLFDQFIPQIISGFAQTLALSDRSLYSAGLTDENITTMAEFFKALAETPNYNQIIEEALSNQNEVDALTRRLNQ